ncbi:hypothetical protein OC844_005522 [Tilletia horrida]|nr:hypothetical protein OC844_005522 [Tilletia horrida]
MPPSLPMQQGNVQVNIDGASSTMHPSLPVEQDNGTAQVPPPASNPDSTQSTVMLANGSEQPNPVGPVFAMDSAPLPWSDLALDHNVFLPPLSDSVPPRMDGDVDLFDWSIVVNMIASRPDGVLTDGIWRLFRTTYLHLPPSKRRTKWSVIEQRYGSRAKGSRLICELGAVAHIVNCQVPNFDYTVYGEGIRIPVTKTPYHLFRLNPMRWNDDTREFEYTSTCPSLGLSF